MIRVLLVINFIIGLAALVVALGCRRRVLSGRAAADGFVEMLRERGLVVCAS